ncbi:unnamed protein product [Adineta ricciae]|uniref:Methyltransferase FkbM domain-containing protein n=1 Tax=Adineta ricciae TaxID=249248 RepID=A0A815FQQ5_ADIRI|nr:unnamed protein product [Adineta ricciae]CAF1414079.1 unnamed protein product [Adineta ricciae]
MLIRSLVGNPADEQDISNSRKAYYYDYEPYLKKETSQTNNTFHQFYYIDLGCSDGRDIQHFLYFHSKEILDAGNLSIIGFEPDPINYFACKAEQNLPISATKTVYNTAAWIKSDEVPYATEMGQKSRIDHNSTTRVLSLDFSRWILEKFKPEHYVYIKFTIEGAEIEVLEKMVADRSLALVDYLEIEWTHPVSSDYEPRRISLECMFDNFGMDYLYMIDVADMDIAQTHNETYEAVRKDSGWKLNTSLTRFHYRTRKEVPTLLNERLHRRK